MVRDAEIGWLAGILDGEGSITLSKGVLVGNPPRKSLHAMVMVANTSLPLLEKVQSVLRELGVHDAKMYLMNLNHRNERFRSTRPCYRVCVGTCAGMRRLLEAVLPQLTSKRAQAILLLEYLERRNPPARTRANERDYEIHILISELNRGLRDSVETETPPGESRMTQSELHGDVQSAAETTAPAIRRVK